MANFVSKLSGVLNVFKKKVSEGKAIVKTVKAKVESVDKAKLKAIKEKLGTVSKKAFLAGTKHSLKKFYSDKNYKSVISLVNTDADVLGEKEFSVDVNLPKALAPLAGTKSDGFDAAGKLDKLNYFKLQKEVKLQSELVALFGEDKVFPSKLAKERFANLSSKLTAVSPTVLSAHKKRGLQPVYNDKIAKISDDLNTFLGLVKLLK
jgi:hypothetical protein